jgi:hypothetical protein
LPCDVAMAARRDPRLPDGLIGQCQCLGTKAQSCSQNLDSQESAPLIQVEYELCLVSSTRIHRHLSNRLTVSDHINDANISSVYFPVMAHMHDPSIAGTEVPGMPKYSAHHLPLNPNPPKARLPGKGESQPAVGEGCCPFEPGRVRDDLVLRARWESAYADRHAGYGHPLGDDLMAGSLHADGAENIDVIGVPNRTPGYSRAAENGRWEHGTGTGFSLPLAESELLY